MTSPLAYLPWPSNLRFRVNIAGTGWLDVSRWVQRQGLSIGFSTDTFTSESTVPLLIPDSATQPIFEAWQEVRIDNPLPQTGTTYERYVKGYIGDYTSDPQAPNRKIVLHVLGGLAILDRAQNAIIGPYTYPSGTADNAIIADLVTYAGMAGEISTVPSVNHCFDLDAEITFTNCTLLEALQQLQQATPSGTEAPSFMMNWYPDDPPTHSDNWGWRLGWFQSPLIPLSGAKLGDNTTETLGEAFYRELSRTRDGKPVVNRQTVVGGPDPVTGLPITVTVNSSTSQTYLGRILAGKPIVDSTLDTVDKVAARARLEIDRYKDVLETLSNIKTLVPYGINGPWRVQIKRAIEPGIDTYQTYLITKISLQWDNAGLAYWTLTLGVGLPELGRSGVGWRGGIRYQQPTPPPQVTGLATITNEFWGPTQSARWRVGWTLLSTGNIRNYRVTLRWFDGVIWREEYIDIPHPTADCYLANANGGLIPGQTYYCRVQAFNIFSQYGPPSTQISIVAAAVAAPPPPTAVTFGTGTWDAGGAVQPLTLTLPLVHAAFTRISVAESGAGAPTVYPDLTIPGGQTAATLYGLHRSIAYTVTIHSQTQYGNEGTALIGTFTAATEAPAAPTGLSATYGISTDSEGGYLQVDFTASTFTPLAYYEVEITQPGGSYRRPTQILRADAVSFIATGLPVGVALCMNMRGISGYGYFPGPYTPNENFTIGADDPPAPPDPPGITFGAPGWDTAGVEQPISWNAPTPVPDRIRVKVYPTGHPDQAIKNDLVPGADTAYTIYQATRGVTYTVELSSVSGRGYESSTPTSATFTAATESPPAPTGLTPDQRGVSATGLGFLKAHWTATSWPDASRYHWTITLQTGGPILAQGDLPRVGGVLPTAGTLPNLPLNRALRLRLYTVSAYDIFGPASSPLDFAILSQPGGSLPPIGTTDPTVSTDQPAQWTATVGAGTSGGVDFTGAAPRLTSVLPAASVAHDWRGDAFAASEGLTVQLVTAREATVATGTALAGVEWYDGIPGVGGTSLISTSTVWSGAPTTGAVTAPADKQTATAPAGTKAGVVLLRYTGVGTASTLYWSVDPLRFRAQATPPSIAPNAVIGTKQALGIPAFMPNGSMEVQSDTAVFADGYVYTGTATWGTPASGDYEGSKAITLGGVTGTHTLRSPLAIWLTPASTNQRDLRVRWVDTDIGGGSLTASSMAARFYDSTFVQVGSDVALYGSTGVAYVWTPASAVRETAFIRAVDIPSGAVYVALVWSITTTGVRSIVFDALNLAIIDSDHTVSLTIWDLTSNRAFGQIDDDGGVGLALRDVGGTNYSVRVGHGATDAVLTLNDHGAGTPAWNLPILSSDPATLIDGDVWVLDSGGAQVWRAQVAGSTVTLGPTGGGGGAPAPVLETADFTVNSSDASGVAHRCDSTGLSADLNVTLCSAAAVPDGWQVKFIHIASSNQTIITKDAHDAILKTTGPDTAFTITPGQSLTLESNGVDMWYIMAVYL